MGLFVDVFRWSLEDCTNNGISKTARILCVVNAEGPFDPRPGIPAALLECGAYPGLVNIVPAELVDGRWQKVKAWTMMGGNFGYTSDSRFREAVERLAGARCQGAIPIHDRIE